MTPSNDPLIADYRQAMSALRDGRTLLPITPVEIADKLNARQKRGFVDHALSVCRRLYLAYLRWELAQLISVMDSMPFERRAQVAAEEHRHRTKLLRIANEAGRRKVEAEHRMTEILMQREHLEGGAR